MTFHNTGSSLLDHIASERDRIRAAWSRPPVLLVPQQPTPPPAPVVLVFPPLPPRNIKPVDERIAEANKFIGELPKAIVREIKDCILESARDFGESSSLDTPRVCGCPEIVVPPSTITVARIQAVVAEHFGITRDQILSGKRSNYITRPRQIAMYLAKNLTRRSFPDIGRRFGGRDHTTVFYARRKIDLMIAESWWFEQEISMLRRMLSP